MIINWGDAPFKAFIAVTYPRGTCTCTLGNKSYTHSGGGTHTFAVNKKGTWTVTVTDGSISASKTVTITTRNQSESVSPILYLFNGADVSGLTGGWSKLAHSGWRSTYMALYNSDVVGIGYAANADSNYGSSAWYAATNAAIDLTGYKTLNFSIVEASTGGISFSPKLYLYANDTQFESVAAYPPEFSRSLCIVSGSNTGTTSGQTGINSIDISGLSGKYYIGFCYAVQAMDQGYYQTCKLTADKVYLST